MRMAEHDIAIATENAPDAARLMIVVHMNLISVTLTDRAAIVLRVPKNAKTFLCRRVPARAIGPRILAFRPTASFHVSDS